MSMRGCHLAPSAVNAHCGMVYRGRRQRKHRGRRMRFRAPGSSFCNSRAKPLRETHTRIGREPQFSLLRGQPPEWEPARASHQEASGCFWGESCPFSKSLPTWVTMDRVCLGERPQQPRSSVLCLAGPTCGYVWRNVRTLCEMDLAVFGKRLHFRVFPSLQLPVIRFSSLSMARPQTKLVSTLSSFDEKGILMLILTVPSVEEHLPSNLWNYSHFKKNQSEIAQYGTKASPGQHRCLAVHFMHIPLGVGTECLGRGRAPGATRFCLEATSLFLSKEECLAMCSC